MFSKKSKKIFSNNIINIILLVVILVLLYIFLRKNIYEDFITRRQRFYIGKKIAQCVRHNILDKTSIYNCYSTSYCGALKKGKACKEMIETAKDNEQKKINTYVIRMNNCINGKKNISKDEAIRQCKTECDKKYRFRTEKRGSRDPKSCEKIVNNFISKKDTGKKQDGHSQNGSEMVLRSDCLKKAGRGRRSYKKRRLCYKKARNLSHWHV